MREPSYIESARTMQRIGHAVLALFIAVGLMVWGSIAVLVLLETLGIRAPSRAALILNALTLGVSWVLVYRAIRRRRAL